MGRQVVRQRLARMALVKYRFAIRRPGMPHRSKAVSHAVSSSSDSV